MFMYQQAPRLLRDLRGSLVKVAVEDSQT